MPLELNRYPLCMPRFFGGRGCLCRASPLFRGDFAFFRVAARTAALPFRFAGVRTFPKRLGDQPLPAGDPLSGRLSPTFGALFWLMKIIKTRFLDFSEGDSIFFEKSYFKFYFHSMENMKIFLNFIICAGWVLVKIMKYPEKIQILRMIFMKLYPLEMEESRYCGPPQKIGSP